METTRDKLADARWYSFHFEQVQSQLIRDFGVTCMMRTDLIAELMATAQAEHNNKNC